MSWFVAATGSGEMPSERASTFAEPPGTTATAGHVPRRRSSPGLPSSPLTTPLTVPSPPCTMTRSTPSRGGRCRDFDPVAAVVGVLDGELQAALERVSQQVAAGRSGRSGCWVHDQHGAHDARAYAVTLRPGCGGTARSYADAVNLSTPARGVLACPGRRARRGPHRRGRRAWPRWWWRWCWWCAGSRAPTSGWSTAWARRSGSCWSAAWCSPPDGR